MNWIKFSGEEDRFHCNTDNGSYDILLIDGAWAACFVRKLGTIGGRSSGYLSSALQIECGFGIVAAQGLKPNCQFSSKEEAVNNHQYKAGGLCEVA